MLERGRRHSPGQVGVRAPLHPEASKREPISGTHSLGERQSRGQAGDGAQMDFYQISQHKNRRYIMSMGKYYEGESAAMLNDVTVNVSHDQ